MKKLLSTLILMILSISIFVGCAESATKSWTVTFDSDGGSAVVAATVLDGEKVTEPADPTKDGYAFIAWTLDGVAYDFESAVIGDIELKATWEKIEDPAPVEHTVTFNSNGGTAVPSVLVTDGTKVSKPEDPTKEGYTFVGWLLNGSAYDFETPVTGDIALKAEWKAKEASYKIEFYAEGLDGTYSLLKSEDKTDKTNSEVSVNANEFDLPVGFEFDAENENNVTVGNVSGSGGLVLKVYLKRLSVTVTYYDADGSLLETEQVKYEGSATYSVTPIKEESDWLYVFRGWVTEKGGETAADLSSIKAEISVYAFYAKQKVAISLIDELWNVARSVEIVTDVVYGEEAQSTKIGFGSGEKYGSVNVHTLEKNVKYIEFYLKNTTGKELEIYTDQSLEENNGTTVIAAGEEWQKIRLAIDSNSSVNKLMIRGKGETVVNENEFAYVYISDSAGSEAGAISKDTSDPWSVPQSVEPSEDYVYGTEAKSTKVGFQVGYKYARLIVSTTSERIGHIEFYIKNTTGKALEIFTEPSLTENGGTTKIAASDEWQKIYLALDASKTENIIYVRGDGETVVCETGIAYFYISEITEIEVKASLSKDTSDPWSEPENVALSEETVYGTETKSTKVGFKTGYKMARLIVSTTSAKIGHIEFYIKNTTGKALEIFTEPSLTENGGTTKVSAGDEWQKIYLALDASKTENIIYVRGDGETVVCETGIAYFYVSEITEIEVKASLSKDTSDPWSEPESVALSEETVYGTETKSTKVGFKTGYKYARLIVSTTSERIGHIEFYIKNTTGKALEIFTEPSLTENGGTTKVSSGDEWQKIYLALDASKTENIIYVRGDGETVVCETGIAYFYVSEITEIEVKASLSKDTSDPWSEPESVALSEETAYGTETKSTKVGFKTGYKMARLIVSTTSAKIGHIEFYIKNTTGKALEIFTDSSLTENGGTTKVSAGDEWQKIYLALDASKTENIIYIRGDGETVVCETGIAYFYVSEITEN